MSASARLSKLPLVPLVGDSDYVILKEMLVNGMKLSHGDHLPSDSPLRDNPKRLETLCRLRMLAPISLVAEPAKVSTAKPTPQAKEEVATPNTPKVDVDAFSFAQMLKECKRLKLKTNGTKQELRERLRTALG